MLIWLSFCLKHLPHPLLSCQSERQLLVVFAQQELKYVWFGTGFKSTKFMILCKTNFHGEKKKKIAEEKRK